MESEYDRGKSGNTVWPRTNGYKLVVFGCVLGDILEKNNSSKPMRLRNFWKVKFLYEGVCVTLFPVIAQSCRSLRNDVQTSRAPSQSATPWRDFTMRACYQFSPCCNTKHNEGWKEQQSLPCPCGNGYQFWYLVMFPISLWFPPCTPILTGPTVPWMCVVEWEKVERSPKDTWVLLPCKIVKPEGI